MLLTKMKYNEKSNLFITDPDAVVFDSVLVGDSAVTTVNLLNNSSHDEIITITDFFHKDSSFKIEHELPFVLPKEGSEQIEIMFKPSTAGFYIDTLHIRSDTDARRIAQILVLSGTADTVSEIEIVYSFKLEQNYPNPFNSTTTIIYEIPELSFVTLRIYDILGNEITTLINEEKGLGNYQIEFDGSVLSSGIYFYQLKTGSFLETKKMILIK